MPFGMRCGRVPSPLMRFFPPTPKGSELCNVSFRYSRQHKFRLDLRMVTLETSQFRHSIPIGPRPAADSQRLTTNRFIESAPDQHSSLTVPFSPEHFR